MIRAEVHENVPDDAQELSVRALSTPLLYFGRLHGKAKLEEMWNSQGFSLPLKYLQKLSNYVSFNFTQKLIAALAVASGDPDFGRNAARLTATPEAIGFAYYMLKAFGSPRLAFMSTVQLGPSLNRVGEFKIEKITDNSMVLAYVSSQPERGRVFCEMRQVQFASFPTIWNLPPAAVHEVCCQLEGAACCRYHFEWRNPDPLWKRHRGTAAGLVLGAVAVGAAGSVPHSVVAPAVVLLGTLLGSWFDARRALQRKDEQLRSHNDGLQQSMQDLRLRHEETRQAKLEVERVNAVLEKRVEERTRELSEANAKLAQAIEHLTEVDKRKTEFFDNVSHELRTPLTLILLALEELLGDASLDELTRQHLRTMDRSGARLLTVINQLLDLAKLEAGKGRLNYQSIALGGFIRTLVLPFQIMAREKQVRLWVEGDWVAPIHGDLEMLEGVFQNLVSNALKFTSEGHVLLRLSETESKVRVDVEDTGMGVSPSDLPMIFDRFAQADSLGIRRFGGTGIGLALVKEMVELHGGTISVVSQLGRGSTFTVVLPKGTAHVREDLRERRVLELPLPRASRRPLPQPSDSLGSPAVAPIASARTHTILFVEDDPEIRRVVGNLLRSRYRVVEASNGREGEDKARAEKPDLVLADIMMPRQSGVQLTQALKANPATANVPIILLTARRDIESTLGGFTAGASDYVTKPFSPKELLARIDTQIRLREATALYASNERLATMGLLTGGFAHEVRNPLNGLINILAPLKETLSTGEDLETARGFIEIIEECGSRIRHLSETLLSFTNCGQSEALLDVTASLEATLRVLEWKTPKTIRVEKSYRTAERILGVEGSLNQVWLNLLDNAVRAMGQQGTLKVGVRRVEDEVCIDISDTGAGIAPHHLERLFQPFFTTRPAGEGTGLGLALSHRIVVAHRGKIEVESALGRGTRFTVRLPRPKDKTEGVARSAS